MIDTYKKAKLQLIKPILSWLVIIIVGIVSGREITQYIYDNSQTRRIAQLQKEIVLNTLNDNDDTSNELSNELHKNITEIVSHAKDKTRCLSAIEDELTALKHAVNDDSDVSSVNVSIMHTVQTRAHTDTLTASTSTAQALIKKYIVLLTDSCK